MQTIGLQLSHLSEWNGSCRNGGCRNGACPPECLEPSGNFTLSGEWSPCLLHAYVIVSYVSVSCSLCIFLPLSIVIDGLKHKVNKNAMSCNHNGNEKCAKHRRWFSQAIDWKLLLHLESRVGVQQRRHRASTHVTFCPQLVTTTLDVTCNLQRWHRCCAMFVNYRVSRLAFLLSVKNKANWWSLRLYSNYSHLIYVFFTSISN